MPPSSLTDHTPSLALYFFNQISRYPRQSRQEGAIRDFITGWAKSHAYHTVVDKAGNCIITVPADEEKRASEPIALQAHFDMVCEVAEGHQHDFSKDPIIPQYKDNWVRARNTTLGADNGIGMALMLALCEDPLVIHPKMELVFTVDEETGLTGAAMLGKNAISAKYLLNLDSEDDEILINGCAGGENIYVSTHRKKFSGNTTFPVKKAYHLHISGFSGGHSGVDIHKPIGNAICCMAEVLHVLLDDLRDECYLGAITGGTVHNAIPRSCTAQLLFTHKEHANRANRIVQDALKTYATTHSITEKNIQANLSPIKHNFPILDPSTSSKFIALLRELPHGVKSFTQNRNIPQTSSNIAQIDQKGDCDRILLSLRSSNTEELANFSCTISDTIATHDAQCEKSGLYPAWHPKPNSKLLTSYKQAYQKARGTPPRVEVIHAGLETAVIAQIAPELDMLSVGPLILNPHSPQERLSISSTAHLYRTLAQFLKDW